MNSYNNKVYISKVYLFLPVARILRLARSVFFHFFRNSKNEKYPKLSTGKVVYSIIITHGSGGTGGKAPRRQMLGIIANLSFLRHQLLLLRHQLSYKTIFLFFFLHFFTNILHFSVLKFYKDSENVILFFLGSVLFEICTRFKPKSDLTVHYI